MEDDVTPADTSDIPTPVPANRTFPRGAKPTPRHRLLAAVPHLVIVAPPPQLGTPLPKQLSFWLNNQYGDCVAAQEAFAKAAWSVMCGLPELFVPDAEVGRWASKYGFLNGAMLPDVMDQMARDGFTVVGVNYKDGTYNGVDYSNETVLQSALVVGPLNIAIDADALPSGAGNNMGWFKVGGRPGQYPNTDHCVALPSDYGTAKFLYESVLGLPVPPGLDPTATGYLLFTWNTIGFVDHAWLMSTCTEAWVRNPTTPGQSPPPVPPPVPPVPPSPPVPPPPPAPLVVVGQVQPVTAPVSVRVLGFTFSGTAAVPGQAVTSTQLLSRLRLPVGVSWWALARDLWQLYRDVSVVDVPAVTAAVRKLFADLPTFNLAVLNVDVMALLALAGALSLPAIEADVVAIIADLGITPPF